MTNATPATELDPKDAVCDPNATAVAMENYFLNVNVCDSSGYLVQPFTAQPTGEIRFIPWIWKHETNQVCGYVAFVVNVDNGKSQRRLKNVTALADMETLAGACISREVSLSYDRSHPWAC